ncbi:MAG: epimerase [Candidatus Omnitrophota bacterium]
MEKDYAYPPVIETEEELEEILSRPDAGVIDALSRLDGDLILLGAGGKMGPTLALMARRAFVAAGTDKRVIGVSRFSEPGLRERLERNGVETIAGDLLDREFLGQLPEARNVIFMAGRKFGSTGQEWLTWAMNVYLPGLAAERFRHSRIAAFSTGNVYPLVAPASGGSVETDVPAPIGEYAQSCLGRERIFQHFSQLHKTPGVLLRLNYAVEMRYGALMDIAKKVYEQTPIPLAMGYVNVIWQGDANRWALRSLSLCETPFRILNIAGPEIVSIRWLAQRFGDKFAKNPIFHGEEAETALLNNPAQAVNLFGTPSVSIERIIGWAAHWILSNGPMYDKPTHYEQRDGKF